MVDAHTVTNKLTGGGGDDDDDDSPEPPKALIVVFDSLARFCCRTCPDPVCCVTSLLACDPECLACSFLFRPRGGQFFFAVHMPLFSGEDWCETDKSLLAACPAHKPEHKAARAALGHPCTRDADVGIAVAVPSANTPETT